MGRSPHGERGLKWGDASAVLVEDVSLSSWRAWIEIIRLMPPIVHTKSLSSWRAWIEILIPYRLAANVLVALLMESVD